MHRHGAAWLSSVLESLKRHMRKAEFSCVQLQNNKMRTSEESISVVKRKVQRKIGFIEDADATGEVAKVYDEWRAHSGRQNMPGILKCFSHRPDFLRQVMDFSNTVHFSEGHLDRKTKEAIASYVSYLNRCPY